MSFTEGPGRLCNQIIRGFAVSRIAKKHDLYVNYYNHQQIKRLGIEFYVGTKTHSRQNYINEENYTQIFQADSIDFDLDASSAYFQTNEIAQLLYQYLQSESTRETVMKANPFRERYQTNNDVCIHIRLTDASKNNPGVDYYLNTLKSIQFDTLYICTDEPAHAIIQTLQSHYPNLQLVPYDEIETIQFASTCKHIILSHGTYSAMIGYIAYFSNVHYPEYIKDKMWHGDVFSIDGWIKHSLNNSSVDS